MIANFVVKADRQFPVESIPLIFQMTFSVFGLLQLFLKPVACSSTEGLQEKNLTTFYHFFR
jgi:hypothetical protein